MSKIYEALLRAELDRNAHNGDHPATPLESAQTQSLPTESAPTGSFPTGLSPSTPERLDPEFPDPQILDQSKAHPTGRAQEQSYPLPHSVPTSTRFESSNGSFERLSSPLTSIDFGQVRHTIWNPSLGQLPALDNRGGGVEQFRSLRSRMHEFRDLNTLKSILVSSGLPQEGKSFVAANLAIAFARHKASRVLLIDGDMRRSSLHKLLGCPSEPGLAEYLSGKASAIEIMQRPAPGSTEAPLHPGLASLTFIPGGSDNDKAADLSGNQRFSQLIAALAPSFDWIVVDSSPVNLVADGVNLARACDAVLLVARGGVTKFEAAQRAITELKASKILGLVLNAVEKPPKTGGYYGYDSYDKAAE